VRNVIVLMLVSSAACGTVGATNAPQVGGVKAQSITTYNCMLTATECAQAEQAAWLLNQHGGNFMKLSGEGADIVIVEAQVRTTWADHRKLTVPAVLGEQVSSALRLIPAPEVMHRQGHMIFVQAKPGAVSATEMVENFMTALSAEGK
jgi:hypothetical protein